MENKNLNNLFPSFNQVRRLIVPKHIFRSTSWSMPEQVRCVFELGAINFAITIFVSDVEDLLCAFGMLVGIDGLRKFLQVNHAVHVAIITAKRIGEWFYLRGRVLWYLASTTATDPTANRVAYETRDSFTYCAAHVFTRAFGSKGCCGQHHNGQKHDFINGRHLKTNFKNN